MGGKKTFACALDWPGWCRAARDETSALETLSAYALRYRPVARRAGVAFPTTFRFDVTERLAGTATTDFGAPGVVARADRQPLTAAQARRLATLLEAAWAELDDVVSKAPAGLRKGPRGGGRDRDAIARHVTEAELSYARYLGFTNRGVRADDRDAIGQRRREIADALAAARTAPDDAKRWPPRYAARRMAWHALDHAWEIEDRSEGPPDPQSLQSSRRKAATKAS